MEAKDKVAVITGASSGIGRQSALVLLEAGYSVVLAGRRAELLDSAIDEAGAPAGKALAVPTDVSEPESIKNLFAKTVEAFGRLDLLFNNAGQFSPRDPLEDLTIEQWTTVVNVNLNGVFYCTQEAIKDHEEPDAHGRAHHQQRLHLRPRAASQLRALHRYEARRDRPHQGNLARRSQVRHRLLPDRHRQRGDGAVGREPRRATSSPTATSSWRRG